MRVLEHDAWQSFKLPSEHKRALRRVADAQDRSVSDLLRELVEVALMPGTYEQRERPNAFVGTHEQ